jgi:hypothetical protein
MAAHESEEGGGGAGGDEQRILEEGAESGAAFLVDERLGLLAEASEQGALRGATGGSGRRGWCG